MLLLVSVAIAAGFLIAFLWAVRSGQMDDKYTPSVRMLFDDQKPVQKKSEKKEAKEEFEKKED
jgi:cbb3-type cytochrome oxidase maturation protein